ncbi:MAG: pyridoxal phosphate-dependent aminotransferase [Candidatus Heimdallarchaeaceae archaeon]
MLKLAKKLEGFEESTIREMTRKAIVNQAINLSQGMPDFEPPQELIEGIMEAIDKKEHQYSITYGNYNLREKISEKLREYNGIEVDPEDEITVCCGASEGISSSILSILNPADEVIIFEPWYENYTPITYIAEGVPKYVQLKKEDFSIDEEMLKEKISKKTKAIIINSPHNPSGKVFSSKEMKLIADICIDNDIVAITDEIYEYIIYDGEKHISLGSIPGMEERTITISGFSKTFSITGWRIGYVAAEKKLMKGIRKVHDYLTVCAPTILQQAAIKTFDLKDDYFSQLVKRYQKNRDYLSKSLNELGFKTIIPKGTYYMFSDISNFKMSDTDFADFLVKNKGVAVVPGSSFYHTENDENIGCNYVRFSFSQKIETLEEAVFRLKERLL